MVKVRNAYKEAVDKKDWRKLNSTRQDEENMEDLLRGVYERMKEQKVKERATRSKAYKENPNPFIAGDGDVLLAVENSEGIWEVANS